MSAAPDPRTDGTLNSDPAAEPALDPATVDSTAMESAATDDGPEKLPMNTWVTLGLFAAFVVAFGTCASSFMFN
ncbi:hypothetical protein [Leucobacter chromiireducens]|uniref:Uncharacterized protein n=1 Tax=Leucobacter chromiireducens subsp. solipictus TaxID=398235 RepID=A0ABS1SGH0_9MICO|nr:hypothetical protein [Leucobacter chromiireducens]MBL3678976.1 hypothetical protein [Leucobacter chromiireducens subsp. solipictus]